MTFFSLSVIYIETILHHYSLRIVRSNRITMKNIKYVLKLHDENVASLVYFARTFLHCEETAKDAVADVFANLLTFCPEFNDEQEAVRYLFVAVRNKCFSILVHRKVVAKYSNYLENGLREADTLSDMEEAEMMMEAKLQQIYHEIQTLPKRMKQIITAFYLENKSIAEIAITLSITEETVRNQIALGKLRIRNNLQQKNKGSGHFTFIFFIVYIIQIIKSFLEAN